MFKFVSSGFMFDSLMLIYIHNLFSHMIFVHWYIHFHVWLFTSWSTKLIGSNLHWFISLCVCCVHIVACLCYYIKFQLMGFYYTKTVAVKPVTLSSDMANKTLWQELLRFMKMWSLIRFGRKEKREASFTRCTLYKNVQSIVEQ